MDPIPTYPLPNEPPIDLARLIQRTNEAAHGMMPMVDGYYQSLEQQTANGEAALKKLAQPLTRSLSVRTSGATKRLNGMSQPIADALASGTAAAQRGMLDFPTPTTTPTSVYRAALHCPDLQGQTIPAERGFPPSPGEGWRTYGPYATAAEAQQALATYRTYLALDASCMGAPAGSGDGPEHTLDYYWVD